jgi:hypothetical protein
MVFGIHVAGKLGPVSAMRGVGKSKKKRRGIRALVSKSYTMVPAFIDPPGLSFARQHAAVQLMAHREYLL